MMHYGSWMDTQNVLDTHRFYPQYIDDSYRPRSEKDDENEQTGDETLTTATSGERSSSADLFRLEFAATQWSKLVTNAEGLFNKLVASNVLPHSEQDQVEQWLCMKQEYEECIGSDESVPYAENTRRSLERIEEVTETDESANLELRSSDATDDERSDVSSDNPDFVEKLDEYMNRFKLETDRLIDSVEDGFREKSLPIISATYQAKNTPIKPIPIRNPNSRRNSMLPGSEMCNEVMVFNGGFRPKNFSSTEHTDNSPDVLVDALKNDEPMKALKTLALNNEAKQTQVKLIQTELNRAHARIEELQTTIRTKEIFIADMVKKIEPWPNGKQKVRKRLRVKKEYSKRSQENMFHEEVNKREIELCKNIALHYEQKRLLDIEKIRQIAGDSARKVQELELSLNSSKKQMESLQRQLKREEERKNLLESELAEDQKKIRELEEKYNLTESKLQEMRSDASEDERTTRSGKNLLLSSKISQIDCALKEKSMDLAKTSDSEEKQALRNEIENLRRTKDRLVEQKCDLDGKWQLEKTLTTDEERQRLECGETIEMIDAMIEHKNEMICGRKNFNKSQSQSESERTIIDKHLSRLSEVEMKQLFYAYFRKVIDLKESSRNLELQANTMELEMTNQALHLTNALKHLKHESEKRVMMQRELKEREEKWHPMFRHFTGEPGTSSAHDKDEFAKLKKENRVLKKRLAYFETLVGGNAVSRTTSPPRIPHLQLKQIAPPPEKTTKVTRKKNKLIIQTTDK